MSVITSRTKELPAEYVTPETEHQYQQARPINYLMVDVAQAVIQTSAALKRKRMTMDLSMTKEQERKAHEVGVFTGHFDGWRCTLNWTPREINGIPPRHIAVFWNDIPVALLPPYADMPQQWKLHTLLPQDLQRDAQTVIAHKTGRDHLFEALGGGGLDSALHEKKGDVAML